MRNIVVSQLRSHRVAELVLLDSLAWIVAFFLASGTRLETWRMANVVHINDAGGAIPLGGTLIVASGAVILHCLLAWALRLHQGRSTLGSFEEVFVLASVVIFVGVALSVVNAVVMPLYLARITPAVAACFAIILAAWPRALWRYAVRDARTTREGVATTRVLIVGAGEAAQQLIESMQRDPEHTWDPVGMVDDDKRKRHFRHRGVPVVGTTSNLVSAAAKVRAATIVIAIPSASSETMGRINDLAQHGGLNVKVLPGVAELLGGVNLTAVRDISPEDLLGRRQIETDINSIAGYLNGKRVLVTGAGGSIGSELCRQIAEFAPAHLMMLDRDESALHALVLSMSGRADLESPNVILANIRDVDRMHEVFETRQPEVVFHAAALKHVNMLETQASEAVKTNILGTLNVLEAARSVGVERFVNISTDKAADPVNVLGYSKRIAEGLTTAIAAASPGTFLSVRFGNVLGTRGSVLKTFESQIESGRPVTVTDPEVTRFFMTIHEAVQLVIQAAAIGDDGEALVLDMGEPVKIADVARQLIEQSHQPIKIVYTGLKHGEKLHEVLFGAGEVDHRPVHPLVSHVNVPVITRDDATSLPKGRNNDEVVLAMKEMAVRMVPNMFIESRK